MLDKFITYIVSWYKTFTRSHPSHCLTAIVIHSDTGSHNRIDLIKSIVPAHYACNWCVSIIFQMLSLRCLSLVTNKTIFKFTGLCWIALVVSVE